MMVEACLGELCTVRSKDSVDAWQRGLDSITFLFLFSVFLMLWHLGPSWLWRDSSSSANQLEITKGSMPFIWKRTSPVPFSELPSLSGSYTPGGSVSLPSSSQSQVPCNSGQPPLPQSLLTSFELASPRPAYLAPSPATSLSFLQTLVLPPCDPAWCGGYPPLENCK